MSEVERVSASDPSNNSGLSCGGRNLAEGNAVPSIISPTPVITTVLFNRGKVSDGWQKAGQDKKPVNDRDTNNAPRALFMEIFREELIKRLTGFGGDFDHSFIFLRSEIIKIVVNGVNILAVKLDLIMKMGSN